MLTYSHNFTDVPGSTYGQLTRIYFTLTTPAVMNLPYGWRFTGRNSPYGDVSVGSNQSHIGFGGIGKDGVFHLVQGLAYTYNSSSLPNGTPMRILLADAGYYFLDYYVNEPSSGTVTATLEAPTQTSKTWIDYGGSMRWYQGQSTNIALYSAGNRSLYWSPTTTSTSIIRIAFSNGGGCRAAYVRAGSFTSANRTVLASSGWSYDDKGGTYNRSLSGTTDLSIPPMIGSAYDQNIGISNASTPFTATIIS
jgi:hypothetical protein